MSGLRLMLLVLLGAGLLLSGCSTGSSPVAGGGSDLPNGTVAAVSGTVLDRDSIPVGGVRVLLRRAVITARGDSVTVEYRDTTDVAGRYRIAEMEQGSYTLYCGRTESGESAIRGGIRFEGGPDTLEPLVLSPWVTLTGHLYMPEHARYGTWTVFVPGTPIRGMVASTGIYVVPRAPAGVLDLAFGFDGTVNVTRIEVLPDAADTVYLRDIEFALLDVMADMVYRGETAEALRAYFVSPVSYAPDLEPSWYEHVDFGFVTHYRGTADGSVVPWTVDTLGTERLYDFVVAGLLYRDSLGRVVLAPYREPVVVLHGTAVEQVGSEVRYATVAIETRVDPATGMTEYWAVEVRYASTSPWSTMW